MVGGTTLGYCATGSENSATPPITIIRMASTFARTGRSMKNFEIMARGCLLAVYLFAVTWWPGLPTRAHWLPTWAPPAADRLSDPGWPPAGRPPPRGHPA